MNENLRIQGLFGNLYNGHPWIDVTIMDNLRKISWNQAGEKIHPELNTIWEIVNHMVSWRQNVLRRVNGEVIKTPADNYFTPLPERSERAWSKTLAELEATQEAWLSFLEKADDDILENRYPVTNMSHYEQIHGIIHHDAYHLGQIVLLIKMQQFMQSA